jgi:hypothetical protein
MAEPADFAGAISLRGFFLETADEHHLVIDVHQRFFIQCRNAAFLFSLDLLVLLSELTGICNGHRISIQNAGGALFICSPARRLRRAFSHFRI